MEKINIAKLLKDCPKGMELDCTMFDGVYFDHVDESRHNSIKCYVNNGNEHFEIAFDEHGQYLSNHSAKCVIFPKGKTTWEGFVPPCKFKIEKGKWYVCTKDLLDNYANKAFRKGDTYLSTQDGSLIPSNSNIPFEVVCASTYFRDWTINDAKDGDVLYHSDSASNGIFIFKELLKREFGEKVICYCDYDSEDGCCLGESHTCCWADAKILHPATKEQRDLLFQKMKEAGYKWNEETKTLEKLVEHRFKVGDRIKHKCPEFRGERTVTICCDTGYWTTINDWIDIEYQDDWELVPAEPKFKDGDIAASNDSLFIGIVKYVDENCIYTYCAINKVGNLTKNFPYFFHRLATEEEKAKLFQAIKDNGYRWNEETKTLEELPKFKVGDRVKSKNCPEAGSFVIVEVKENRYSINIKNYCIEFKDQDNYELVSDKPVFNVGDRVRHKNDKTVITITGIKDNYYLIQFYNSNKNDYQNEKVSFKDQDKYELVSEELVTEFKDGDVITCENHWGQFISIFKENVTERNGFIGYCVFDVDDNEFKVKDSASYFNKARFATKREREQLFRAIERNGYKWNEKNKTLEKVVPKFKVGDRIQGYGTPIRVVKSLECDRYRLDNGNYVKFGDEHAYKLLKFDINTLVPFESKVLVRNDESQYWIPAFWGCKRADGYTTTFGWCKYCIPYNGNEHLLETNKDCDEHFKTWK